MPGRKYNRAREQKMTWGLGRWMWLQVGHQGGLSREEDANIWGQHVPGRENSKCKNLRWEKQALDEQKEASRGGMNEARDGSDQEPSHRGLSKPR